MALIFPLWYFLVLSSSRSPKKSSRPSHLDIVYKSERTSIQAPPEALFLNDDKSLRLNDQIFTSIFQVLQPKLCSPSSCRISSFLCKSYFKIQLIKDQRQGSSQILMEMSPNNRKVVGGVVGFSRSCARHNQVSLCNMVSCHFQTECAQSGGSSEDMSLVDFLLRRN